MAGLIQKNMQPQAPAGAPAEADPETDPAFNAAMQLAMSSLYDNGAAKQIAQQLAANPSVDALANTAYEITSIVDERTDGGVPDELLALLATNILEEVADIAEAAGVTLKPADLAGALKQMILRFVGEQGGDTTQLQAAMDQVDPAEFDRMAADEQVPA